MTDPLLDASLKFIAKAFAVITRGLTSDESKRGKEREREGRTEKESELQRYAASKVRFRVTARRHRVGAGRLVAGCIQKKGPQERTRRRATNRLAGFNRGSSSRETD